MKIFHAIGFGLALVILKIVMPDVFQGFENTLTKFFEVAQSVLGQFPSADQTAMILPHAITLE